MRTALGGPTPGADTRGIFPAASPVDSRPPPAEEAYSLSVTVFPQNGPLGYLATWPTGGPQPLYPRSMAKGLAVANAALVWLVPVGSISVFVTNTTDLTDTAGYFGP